MPSAPFVGVCVSVLVLVLGACAGDGTPAAVDLDGTRSSTPSPGSATSGGGSATPTATAARAGDRAPLVDGPSGLSADQQGALDAYRAYLVAVDALARTNDLDGSGVLEVTSGAIQEGVRTYAEESLRIGRTSDGPPIRVRIRSIDVIGDTASMPVCFDQSLWFDFVGGVPTPAPALLPFDVTVDRLAGTWVVSSVTDATADRCE